MTVAFRQLIYPNDKGGDIFAVRRALRSIGYRSLAITGYTAGPEWVDTLQRFQHYHGIKADGIYGAVTHSKMEIHFDGFSNWLYTHAAIRTHYVNPFRDSTDLEIGRIDQGVDYHGRGPILALTNMRCIGLGGNGWPGGEFMLFQITNGIHAGSYYYLAEAVVPYVSGGQYVKAGQVIAHFRWDAAPGYYPGIETGWGSPIVNLTWYAVHHGGYFEQGATAAGEAFARLLHRIGAPVIDPGPGSEFPS